MSNESVAKPCLVEASEGDVVLECGVAATSLRPAIARDAGKRMIAEADRAEGVDQTGGGEENIGDVDDPGASPVRR